MKAGWDAALYSAFERERTRPAADLLSQVDLDVPALVVDLGCGPGNSTELLVKRFPDARVVGIDTSANMLAAATTRLPACRFEAADIATFETGEPADLLFANASLQWVPGHETLLPRLLGMLRPGGTLAIQMPDNLNEPSHALMRAAAAEPAWSGFMAAAPARQHLLSAEGYYELLTASGAAVEVWRTVYHHPMASAAAIVEWVRATGLRPYLDTLSDAQQGAFLARYERLLDTAYRPRSDNRRLLAFPRLFIVAHRAG